ncbi:hypothetical protein M514_10555 [Trichuris suis]|uniref:Nuclear pore complex protein n=1 Tax=Trichuris suis TaxID=68888 RepID=A0A085NPS3_9BILA|nr:hypothetical protein M513_10555 [Trichuris suis]KFD71469.1 hypothetical protein M514_10555 [Trichuris suis]
MHLICCSEAFRRDGPELILGGTSSVCTLAELKSDHTSGWFSYGNGRTGVDEKFKNRFIMWRSLGQDLLLEERSFSEDISLGSLSIRFTNEVVLRGTTIFETDERLYLLVATTAAAYRIVLRHPRLDMAELRGCSVLSTLKESNLNNAQNSFNYTCPTSEPPYACACALTKNEEAVFALAVEDSCILLVRFAPYASSDPPTQEILWQGSRLKQLWNGLFTSWTPSETFCFESAASLCFVNPRSELTLCTLSFDCRLRLWCFKQRSVVVHFDFNEALSLFCGNLSVHPSWMDGSKWRIKCFSLDNSVCFVAYICVGNVSRFYILRGEKVNRKWAINLVTNFEAFEYDLIDFHLVESRFFGLWASRKGFVVKYKNFSIDPTCRQSDWINIRGLDNMMVQSDVNLELKQLVDKIFSPVQFSFDSLQKALRLCCLDVPIDVNPGDRDALRTVAFHYIVECNYVSETDLANLFSEDGSSKVTENNRLHVARFFTSLWKNCIQYHNLAMQPLGFLFPESSAFAGIITYDRIVAIVDLRTCYFNLALPSAIESGGETLNADFLECLEMIDAIIRSTEQEDEDDLVCTKPWLVACNEATTVASEYARTGAYLRQAIFSSENFFFSCLSRMTDVDPLGRPLNSSAARSTTTASLLSRFAFDILAASLSAFVDEKLAFYRAVLCFVAFWKNHRSISHLPTEAWSKIDGEITQRVTMLCRCYAILSWISKLSLQQPNRNDLFSLTGLGASIMTLCCRCVWNSPELRCQLLDSLREQSVDAEGKFGRMLPHLVLSVVTILWPESGCLPVFECLSAERQSCSVERLGRLLECWCSPAFGLRIFYVGCSLLRMQRFEAAMDYFNRAYADVAAEEPLLLAKLQLKLDYPRIVAYFVKIAELFAEEGCLEMSIKCCKNALQADEHRDGHALVWSNMFAYYLKMADYESALEAALENPNRRQGEKCLDSLLVSMVDQKMNAEVVEFMYADLEDHFIRYMEDKARLSNSLSNVYYDMLYAYFVKRLNYRRAAFYAYEKARRLRSQHEPFRPDLQEEHVNALAATTAALSSVKEPYSWVEVYELDGSENTVDEDSLKLISLREIQRELVLATAVQFVDRSSVLEEPVEPNQLVRALVDQGKHELAEKLTILCSIPSTEFLCSIALLEARQSKYGPQGGPTLPRGSKWPLLRYYLSRYSDDPEIGTIYTEVIKSLLEHGWSPPMWIFDHFRKVDVYHLLLFLFEFGRLQEAVNLVVWICDSALSTRSDDDVSSAGGIVHLPNLLVDNLLLVLEEDSENEENLLLAEKLRSSVTSYYDSVSSDVTDDVNGSDVVT